MRKYIFDLMNKVIGGRSVTADEAHRLTAVTTETPLLMGCAYEIRRHFLKDCVELCAIINAKSGDCPEDCAFCAQSAHNHAKIKSYPLLSSKEIFEAAEAAHHAGACCFGIVTSGEAIFEPAEVERIALAVSDIKSGLPGMEVSVSIGNINREVVRQLIDAGIDKVHHNLETAAANFPRICSTHSFKDKVKAVRLFQEEGIKVCCGGILGMGETTTQRIELALALRDLNISSIPLNFLIPIPGTRLEDEDPLAAMEALKYIAIFRFILPEAQLRVIGGRELVLRGLQSALFMAGASGMMIGNYLTTKGQEAESDYNMLHDLGPIVDWNKKKGSSEN